MSIYTIVAPLFAGAGYSRDSSRPFAATTPHGSHAMKYLVLALVFAAGFATAHLTGLTTAADPKPAEPAEGRAARRTRTST